MLRIVSLIFILVSFTDCTQVCYTESDYNYGCFTDEAPFGGTLQRPFTFLPDKPSKIASRFTLYNKEHTTGIVVNFETSPNFIMPELETKMIIHGFLHHDNHVWVQSMKDAIIKASDVNVITVDWSKGNGFPYIQATANTQVVGREIAKFINAVCTETVQHAEDFHLIGHSLGAHIAGYAGERLKNHYKRQLGRISGLDTAGPYFENTDLIVRLDPTDATFVDAIHTDGSSTMQAGMGIFQMVGHVDFYPNGGLDQPDCPQTSDKLINAITSLVSLDYEGIQDGVACSHNAAIHFFTDSIQNKCKYTSYACDNEADFDAGLCLKCSGKGCNRMGYWATKDKETGKLFLDTQAPLSHPFCMQNYGVTLYNNDIDGILQTRGVFKFYFITASHQSTVHLLDNSEVTFKKGTVEQRLVSLETPLEEDIVDVFISFDKVKNLVSGWLYWDKWSFEYIEVLKAETQTSQKFCPYTPIIQSGSTVRFSRC